MDGLTHCQHSLVEPTVEGKLMMTGLHDLEQDNGGNCGIYDDRPPACRSYSCMWLDGHGAGDDRPDKSGMLCDNVKKIDGCFQAKPIWGGAQDSEAGRLAVERISRSSGLPALVAGFPETHMVRCVGRGIA